MAYCVAGKASQFNPENVTYDNPKPIPKALLMFLFCCRALATSAGYKHVLFGWQDTSVLTVQKNNL